MAIAIEVIEKAIEKLGKEYSTLETKGSGVAEWITGTHGLLGLRRLVDEVNEGSEVKLAPNLPRPATEKSA